MTTREGLASTGRRREKKIGLIEADLSRTWYDIEPADYSRALDRMNT
jgi:hypothetical protein